MIILFKELNEKHLKMNNVIYTICYSNSRKIIIHYMELCLKKNIVIGKHIFNGTLLVTLYGLKKPITTLAVYSDFDKFFKLYNKKIKSDNYTTMHITTFVRNKIKINDYNFY